MHLMFASSCSHVLYCVVTDFLALFRWNLDVDLSSNKFLNSMNVWFGGCFSCFWSRTSILCKETSIWLLESLYNISLDFWIYSWSIRNSILLTYAIYKIWSNSHLDIRSHPPSCPLNKFIKIAVSKSEVFGNILSYNLFFIHVQLKHFWFFPFSIICLFFDRVIIWFLETKRALSFSNQILNNQFAFRDITFLPLMKKNWTLYTSTSVHYLNFSFLVLVGRLCTNFFTCRAFSSPSTCFSYAIHWHGTFFNVAWLLFNGFLGTFFASRLILLKNCQCSIL